jgi:DNA-binding GntR family transcriptional regulator
VRMAARNGEQKSGAATRRTAKGIQKPVRGAADRVVYRAILAAITDHRLAPGTRLTEDRLAAAFGCSRTIVRQALQLLVHDRLLEQLPNRTAAVARPDFDEVREVFAARATIEVPLVAAAARRASAADIASLRRNIEQEKAATEAGDRTAELRLTGEFHRLIAAMSGNRTLAGFVGQLVSRSALILALYENAGTPPCSRHDHAALLAAIASGKAREAQNLMAAHLARLEAGLKPRPASRELDLASLFSPRRGRVATRPPGVGPYGRGSRDMA